MTTSEGVQDHEGRQEPRHGKPRRWKSTLREGLAALVGFLPIFVLVGHEMGWDESPKLAGFLASAAALATALASPAGREWSERYLTGYISPPGGHRDDTPDDTP